MAGWGINILPVEEEPQSSYTARERRRSSMGDLRVMRRQARFTERLSRCKFSDITMRYRSMWADIKITQRRDQAASKSKQYQV
jgi:hypothetical protein